MPLCATLRHVYAGGRFINKGLGYRNIPENVCVLGVLAEKEGFALGTGAVPPPARGTKNPSTGGIFACLRAGRSLRVPLPFCLNKKSPLRGPFVGAGNGTRTHYLSLEG